MVAAIPALNEEQTIGRVVARTLPHVEKVLVIDDGSSDDTGLIAKAMGATVITHHRNLGKGAALRKGFEWAKNSGADVLVTLDADGQHDPSFIPSLVAAIVEGNADIAIGSRPMRPNGMPHSRWMGARVLDNLSGIKVGDRAVDSQSGFRAYSMRALQQVSASEDGMGVDAGIIIQAANRGLKIVEVPVTMNYPVKQPIHRSTFQMLEVLFSIVKFTSIMNPLLFLGGFGAIALGISVAFGLITLDYYQRFHYVVTNMALISVATGIIALLSLFTGVLLFAMITVMRDNRP